MSVVWRVTPQLYAKPRGSHAGSREVLLLRVPGTLGDSGEVRNCCPAPHGPVPASSCGDSECRSDGTRWREVLLTSVHTVLNQPLNQPPGSQLITAQGPRVAGTASVLPPEECFLVPASPCSLAGTFPERQPAGPAGFWFCWTFSYQTL